MQQNKIKSCLTAWLILWTLYAIALFLDDDNAHYQRREGDSNGAPRRQNRALLSTMADTVIPASNAGHDMESPQSDIKRPSVGSDESELGDGTGDIAASDDRRIETQLRESNDTAEAMFVEIEKEKYYGGLETMYHSLLTAQVCRLLNPCMKHDGTVILPKWMARHDGILARTCGLEKVEFTLPDTAPPAGEIKRIDLFGITPPQHHMPSFLRDFLPNIVSFDTAFTNYTIRRTCYTRAGLDCSLFPIVTSPRQHMRPGVFLDPRAKLVREETSWVTQVVRLATPKGARKASLLYWSDTFPRGEESDMQCFRAAYMTKRDLPGRHAIEPQLFERLRFFRDNGISKKPRSVFRQPEPGSGDPGICNVRVMFVNRKPMPDMPDQLLGRYIPNIPEIRDEVGRLTDSQTFTNSGGGNGAMAETKMKMKMNIDVTAVRMEGRTMRWQTNAMQKADVLVAGHGSVLTNMIFMHSRSSILELQPFAYYPRVYEGIARRIANMRYDTFVADPDKEGFDACMAHYYGEGKPGWERAQEVLRRYAKATEDYRKSERNTHSVTLHNLDASLAKVRVCAEMQQLGNDARRLAASIVSLSQSACSADSN